MTILKYFGDRGGDGSSHDGLLHWPGTLDGFPFRGPDIPNLKQDELEALPLSIDFRCRTFELWDEADLAAYTDIRDKAANEWYQVVHIDRHYDKENKHWRIYLEWYQVYGELPDGKSRAYSGPTAGDQLGPGVNIGPSQDGARS